MALARLGIRVEYWGSHAEQSDEHIRLEDYRQGIKQVIATLQEAAALGPTVNRPSTRQSD
ncbi:MAG: hypothetical protein JO057_28545 [Chloroflexi bacterium]|nr:hypothetical protein [Chloroflexota bacterium]